MLPEKTASSSLHDHDAVTGSSFHLYPSSDFAEDMVAVLVSDAKRKNKKKNAKLGKNTATQHYF